MPSDNQPDVVALPVETVDALLNFVDRHVEPATVVVKQDDERMPFTLLSVGADVVDGFGGILGAFFMASPRWFYGPTWYYYPALPQGGFWLGLTLLVLTLCQCSALLYWGYSRMKYLGWLLFLSGIVYWTSGMMLGVEGLMSHNGLIEAPLFLYLGMHKFFRSAALIAQGTKREIEARTESSRYKFWRH